MQCKLRPLVLIILDGFGYRHEAKYNAIAHAKTSQWDRWLATCPNILLDASGTAVGLPPHQMGNSEVGHMHIGAGRMIFQELTEINAAINNQTFFNNPTLKKTILHLKANQKSMHVLGLLSDGGVHSHIDHLIAFLQLCYQEEFYHVYLHLFLDGRDTPPQSAAHYLTQLNAALNRFPVATIASISGRYYAMDRDKRFERLEPVYRLIIEGKALQHADNTTLALEFAYNQGITDEFMPPTQIGNPHPVSSGDACFFFNFRADRARQLTEAIISPDFKGFKCTPPQLHKFISMTAYADNLYTSIAFPKHELQDTFGEIIAKAGLRQLRIAETEKYAHVTFFFNGGIETCFANEDRILIPSPKVKTYDLAPEMSAEALTTALIDAILSQKYDVIICNYANADMVGHTGDFNAAVVAIETLDKAMQKVGETVARINGRLFITADHGNAECMFDDHTNQPHTAHTEEPVPFLCVDPSLRAITDHGSLCDIAPTLLHLLHIPIPQSMTGKILMVERNA